MSGDEYTVRGAVLAAAYIPRLAHDVATDLTRQQQVGERASKHSSQILGASAGRLLRWAYELVDAGADVADVRALIALGMRP